MEKKGGNGSNGENQGNGSNGCCGYWEEIQKAACLTEREKDDLDLANTILMFARKPHRDFSEEIQKMARSGKTELEARDFLKREIPWKLFQKSESSRRKLCYVISLYLKLFRQVEQVVNPDEFWPPAEGQFVLLFEEHENFRSKRTLRKGECVGGFFPQD